MEGKKGNLSTCISNRAVISTLCPTFAGPCDEDRGNGSTEDH